MLHLHRHLPTLHVSLHTNPQTQLHPSSNPNCKNWLLVLILAAAAAAAAAAAVVVFVSGMVMVGCGAYSMASLAGQATWPVVWGLLLAVTGMSACSGIYSGT